jgi:hypothetical protein
VLTISLRGFSFTEAWERIVLLLKSSLYVMIKSNRNICAVIFSFVLCPVIAFSAVRHKDTADSVELLHCHTHFLSMEEDTCDIDIRYPQIKIKENYLDSTRNDKRAAHQKINEYIRNTFGVDRIGEKCHFSAGYHCFYRVERNDKRILSILLIEYSNEDNSRAYFNPFSLNLYTGQLLILNDLFDGPFMTHIIKFINIENNTRSLPLINNETRIDSFAVSSDSLLIYLQGEASYIGMQEYRIPLAYLKKFISSKNILLN